MQLDIHYKLSDIFLKTFFFEFLKRHRIETVKLSKTYEIVLLFL